jgi:pimeloyl-ACP methyl ester carboxylesterase
MKKEKNIPINGEHKRLMPLDYQYDDTLKGVLPVVIFCHGFKGFKDWGAWDLMGDAFAKAGHLFIKFNYSHNGGTMSQPIDFPDLEAFGNNNYSYEVRDTQRVIDWVVKSDLPVDHENITLIGHSRAGGITTLVAQQDLRVKNLITLAAVANYAERFPAGDALQQWRKDGVYYIKNGRTKQEMPLYYQFYLDYQNNKSALNILDHATGLKKPHLIIHGDQDPTVDVKDAYVLQSNSTQSQLMIIPSADHVLGASHPWNSKVLPAHLQQATNGMLQFLQSY